MPNPSLRFNEWYEVDGYPLATHGYALESVTAGMPPKRGSNITAPMLHGQIFQQKRLDPRTETWTMWVCDANPTTGAIPTTEAEKNAQFLENMRTVNRILGSTKELLTVKKVSNTGTTKTITNIVRTSNVVTITTSTTHGVLAGDYISVTMNGTTYDSIEVYGAVVTSVNAGSKTITYTAFQSGTDIASTAATGTLGIFETLQGEAEYLSAIQVSDWKTLKYTTFNIEMTFPDPRWYSINEYEATVTLSADTTEDLILSTSDIGTAPVTKMEIKFTPTGASSLNGPIKLTNITNSPQNVAIGYTNTITSSSNIVTINTDELTVKLNTTNSVEYLFRSGSSYDWFVLFPDESNTIRFTTPSSSSGTAKITYRKAYFI